MMMTIVESDEDTGLVREDGRTDGAGPHAQRRRDVRRLRMGGQMFAEAALVDVVLAAHRTRVRRRPPLHRTATHLFFFKSVLFVCLVFLVTITVCILALVLFRYALKLCQD